MAIIGFYNQLNGRFYGLDELEGMAGVMPAQVLMRMKRHEEKDTRHSGTKRTVTQFNGCPRRVLIDRMLDTKPDPLKMWPAFGGTLLHQQLGEMMGDAYPGKKWFTEELHPDKCVFEGELWGVHTGCKIDLRTEDFSAIWDWKTSFKAADMWVGRDGTFFWKGDNVYRAKGEYCAQGNMCKELMRQSGHPVSDETDIVFWTVSAGWKKAYAPHMDTEQVAGVKVGGSKYTVKQLFLEVHEAYKEWEEEAKKYGGDLEKVPIDARKELIQMMPLRGRDMWKNRKGGYMCTDYCAVNHHCDDVEGGL